MIRDAIQQEVDAWAALGHSALLQRFVLRNGKRFEPTPYLGPKLPFKACFANATNYALANDETAYVEGLAMRPDLGLLVHHAWVEIDGKALDPTWRDPMECQYFGVSFNAEFLREQLLQNKVYGLLEIGSRFNLDLMLKIDPGLLAQYLPKRTE